jgi:hypothetical protein
MSAKYSKSTHGIYPRAVYDTFPSDAIDIPDVLYQRFKNGELSKFDIVDGNVIEFIDTPTLSELKQIKNSEIVKSFTEAIAAGFVTTSTIKMDADITDAQLLKSAYDLMVLLNQTTLPIFVDYNNTPHADMLLTDVIAIIIEVAVNYQTLYAKKQTLRGQLMAAANETELDAITW